MVFGEDDWRSATSEWFDYSRWPDLPYEGPCRNTIMGMHRVSPAAATLECPSFDHHHHDTYCGDDRKLFARFDARYANDLLVAARKLVTIFMYRVPLTGPLEVTYFYEFDPLKLVEYRDPWWIEVELLPFEETVTQP